MIGYIVKDGERERVTYKKPQELYDKARERGSACVEDCHGKRVYWWPGEGWVWVR